MAAARATSALASAIGLPTSRTTNVVNSSPAASTALAAADMAFARSGAGRRPQARAATRAFSTRLRTSSPEVTGTFTTTSEGDCGERLVTSGKARDTGLRQVGVMAHQAGTYRT